MIFCNRDGTHGCVKILYPSSRVHALPITLSQVTFILRRLSQEGLVEKVDGYYYALSRKSALWDIAKNSSPKEIMDFLWELTMEG